METNAKALYQSSRKEWMRSQLKAQLDAITFPASINKIVCFGLGPPSSPHKHGRRRSNIQHAAVESIMENLKRNSDIYCYAQDPAYVDIDKEVLKSIGIETIEDPKGFLEIDENTFIISISPNVPVRQIVSDLQRPAAMLWDTVGSMKDEKENWDKALKG
jgi:SRR1